MGDKDRFTDIDTFKASMEKSYEQYAEECGVDFEQFKRVVRFKREYNPKTHDKEVRRIRIKMRRVFNDPKPKRLRKPSHDPDTTRYMEYENHPLRGRREYQAHPYDIETGVPIPELPIDNGRGVAIKTKLVWPFHFMDIGQSIFVPNMNRRALMRAANNWKYSYRENMYELVGEEYKNVKRSFVVSEVYEKERFTGSRIWLVKKEYVDA